MPPMKHTNQIEIASPRCASSWHRFAISASTDGAIVAPGDAEDRACEDEEFGGGCERGDDRSEPEAGTANEQELAATDAIAERAHRGHEAREQEAVGVHDQSCSALSAWRLVPMCGSARTVTETSIETSSEGSASLARPTHWRAVARS